MTAFTAGAADMARHAAIQSMGQPPVSASSPIGAFGPLPGLSLPIPGFTGGSAVGGRSDNRTAVNFKTGDNNNIWDLIAGLNPDARNINAGTVIILGGALLAGIYLYKRI